MNKRLLWLLVPAVGLIELAAHAYFAGRAPTIEEWRALQPAVAKMRTQDELVVSAPDWTEPLARHALGDALLPLAQVARPDVTSFMRALEISALGGSAPELAEWRITREEKHGRFMLRMRDNPRPQRIAFSFVDGLNPEHVQVHEIGSALRACRWNVHGRVQTGGLGGPPTYPAQRFDCSTPVGVTVIDDEDYRPRRCIWAQASLGTLVLRYNAVALGDHLYGYTGVPWLMGRDGMDARVELEVRVAGSRIGSAVHPNPGAWSRFEFGIGANAGKTADVEFEVRASGGSQRAFCFYADSRWQKLP